MCCRNLLYLLLLLLWRLHLHPHLHPHLHLQNLPKHTSPNRIELTRVEPTPHHIKPHTERAIPIVIR